MKEWTLLQMPLRVLWGAHGVVGQCFDVMKLWGDVADNATGRALDCGHYIAEERAPELLAEMRDFFALRNSAASPATQ